MRAFVVSAQDARDIGAVPDELPAHGFVWLAYTRSEFELGHAELQTQLQRLCGLQLVDLHISDLLNKQLPSHYDYTSQYDRLVFRRLAQGQNEHGLSPPGAPLAQPVKRSGPPVLRRIDTSPVGFVVLDRVLITVHPASCNVLEQAIQRLLAHTGTGRMPGSALPTHPADWALRIVNQMVDGYLDLRRELTRQLDHWQAELLSPTTRFSNWGALLDARMALHQLDDICEDQRVAIQDWIENLNAWEASGEDLTNVGGQRGLELLKVRGRDVLEHIERVVHHVRRLEQNAETAVQMHFSVQSNRTNDTMRTLTALTAIFLPLNLIAGVFGMNFAFIPLLHQKAGFWWAIASMAFISVALGLLFWRKRYIARSGR